MLSSPGSVLELEEPRILAIRLSALGDVLRVLPAFSILRKQLPNAYIGWALESQFAPLFEHHPDIDELFPLERKLGQHSPFRRVRSLINVIRMLRSRQFDLAIDFHGILKSGVVSKLSGAPMRVGYARPESREGNFLFNNYHVPAPGHRLNRVDRNLALLKHLGIADRSYHLQLPRPEPDRRSVGALLEKTRTAHDRPFILLYPGTSHAGRDKRWPAEWWVDLAHMLAREGSHELLLAWGPDDWDIVESIVADKPPLRVIPPTSLPELVELIRRASLFIGGDTGPMHIAWIVDTPLVALFGQSNRIQNSPPPTARFRLIREPALNILRKDTARRKELLEALRVAVSELTG